MCLFCMNSFRAFVAASVASRRRHRADYRNASMASRRGRLDGVEATPRPPPRHRGGDALVTTPSRRWRKDKGHRINTMIGVVLDVQSDHRVEEAQDRREGPGPLYRQGVGLQRKS